MKKFKFKLEPLLALRRLHEDQKKRVVASLQGEINEQQRQALQMAGEVERHGKLLKERQGRGTVDLAWVAHYRSYVTHMQRAIAQRISRVARIQQDLGIARQELAEAAKQTKILEKLKEKRRTRYEHDIRRAEAAELDDIGAKMFLYRARTA